MKGNETLKTEFELMNSDTQEYEKKVSALIGVVWRNQLYSENHGYIGARFMDMSQKEGELLHQFVKDRI